MIRTRSAVSAAVAVAIFAAAGVGGVIAFRVIRAVSETLKQQTPAHTASAGSGAGTVFTTMVTGPGYAVQVDVDPVRTGSNLIHLYAYTPDKQPLRVVEWTGTAVLPDKGVEPVAISLLALTDSHSVGQVDLPAPGDWHLRFIVRMSATDQATINVTVPVRR